MVERKGMGGEGKEERWEECRAVGSSTAGTAMAILVFKQFLTMHAQTKV